MLQHLSKFTPNHCARRAHLENDPPKAPPAGSPDGTRPRWSKVEPIPSDTKTYKN